MSPSRPTCVQGRLALAGVACVVGLALLIVCGGHAQTGSRVASVEVRGTIDPATQRWMAAALDDARERGAEAVIVRLDTPGGPDSSMRARRAAQRPDNPEEGNVP
jgi:membrane-bound serine protease (ClpP class)